ncbi:MAG: helix-turn-helix transcriptional regulator [Bacteroidales bacterium]|jgi:transcriptional regulator with XRE-family HTH domain
MKERLKEIMDKHQLTPLAMAEKMGIQRSSISHLLSGRNKPSYDFIQKFLEAYPFVDAHWFITGGYKQPPQEQKQHSLFDDVKPSADKAPSLFDNSNLNKESDQIRDAKRENSAIPSEIKNSPTITRHNSAPEPTVQRIVWFYDDGSFKEYKPALE